MKSLTKMMGYLEDPSQENVTYDDLVDIKESVR